jgi:hypothetical protein
VRTKIVLISILLCAATTFWACSKSRDRISGPTGDENLLINSSFEINGEPSLHGWVVSQPAAVHFSENTPPMGGSWSVAMGPGWIPMVYFISETIAAPEGTHRYTLSFWAKKRDVGGWAEFILKQPDSSIVCKTMLVPDSTWTFYSLLDTVSANDGDSLTIKLTGGWSELAGGETFYDLVRLEKLH